MFCSYTICYVVIVGWLLNGLVAVFVCYVLILLDLSVFDWLFTVTYFGLVCCLLNVECVVLIVCIGA